MLILCGLASNVPANLVNILFIGHATVSVNEEVTGDTVSSTV